MFFFFFFFFHKAEGGAFCVFFCVVNCQHADQKQLVRRWPFDLDIESAHGQPALCRARPSSLGDGLGYFRSIHVLGDQSLPAASYALLPNPKKKTFFSESLTSAPRSDFNT